MYFIQPAQIISKTNQSTVDCLTQKSSDCGVLDWPIVCERHHLASSVFVDRSTWLPSIHLFMLVPNSTHFAPGYTSFPLTPPRHHIQSKGALTLLAVCSYVRFCTWLNRAAVVVASPDADALSDGNRTRNGVQVFVRAVRFGSRPESRLDVSCVSA